LALLRALLDERNRFGRLPIAVIRASPLPRGELMRRAFLVCRLAAFSGNFALAGRIH
jgi:hypothetical protein